MKNRIISLLIPAVVLFAGCEKWNPTEYSVPVTTQADKVSPDTAIVDLFVPEDEDDDISKSKFKRTISIAFSPSGATVSGDVDGLVSVNGNHVTVNAEAIDEAIRYELSGTATDGFLKIYGAKKQALVLNGLNLTNPDGAAINNQNKKRTFVVLNGTNTLADGASYTQTPEGEDEKGAFFSEAQLIFSGTGSLTVTANGKAGISSDDYIRFLDDVNVKVTSSAGHAVRGKDAVLVTKGTLDLTASAAGKKGISSDGTVRFDGGQTTIKVSGGVDTTDPADLSASSGVKADSTFVMNGGTLTVSNSGQGGKAISGDGYGLFAGGKVYASVTGTNYSSGTDDSKSAKAIKFDGKLVITGGEIYAHAKNHEAIESKGDIVVTGGTVYAESSDDAVNSAGNMVIAGGSICAYSTGNDGLDANGNCYIQGGLVYAIGSGSPEVAVDANTEGGYKLHFSGGTLVAIGGLEQGSALGQACYTASWSQNTWYALCQDGQPVFVFKTPNRGGTSLIVSTGGTTTLNSGVSTSGGTSVFEGMAVLDATVTGGGSVSLNGYSSGSGMSGPGGGPGVPGGPGGGR